MEREDIHILRLMGEVEKGGSYSQRELARRLNLSLGLVNTFIKRLVNKGYFKVKTLPRNRVKYLLTPKGLAQKSRLTVEYLRYSINFYREIKQMLLHKFQDLEQKGIVKLLFYGSGEVAELAYLYLQMTPLSLVGVVDQDRGGGNFFGLPISDHERLQKQDWDGILLTRLDHTEADLEFLLRQGIAIERIVIL